ncbi:MAG: SDR family NAD(P)-dependent oxidoreductase [Gemmatimonadales bacterium]
MSLSEKVVLITGGSSGIGRSMVHGFAQAGAKVVFAGRNQERGAKVEQEVRETPGQARFIRADVSRAEEVERLVAEAMQLHGRLDAAVNNAATLDGVFALTADFTPEQFDQALTLNLKSVWLCMAQEIRRMLEQSPAGGAIVNTSSVNGLGGAAGGSLYSAAKAGILALTKSAAQEYATKGVRVNALVAGAFRTPMLEGVFTAAGGDTEEGRASVEQQYTNLIPMRRIGRPEEAAAVALWLCSDASSYVTGHSMIVDGGMSAGTR